MNNSIEFEIAADVLSSVAAFSKEIAAQSLNRIDSEFFISAVLHLVQTMYGYGNAVLFYRLEQSGPLFCSSPESESPCSVSAFEEYIPSICKIEVEYRNSGKTVKSEYRAYLCLSFFLKKEFFFSILVCGKKSEVKEAEQIAPFLQSYIASEFRRIRKSKKEIKSVKTNEQETLLKRTKQILRTRKSNQRWFADNSESSFAAGTDFSGLYPCGNDTWLSCLCDVAVPPDARNTVLILIDAYMSLLARSGCTAESAVLRIGQAIRDKAMEMYVSVICTLYDKKNDTVTMCGAGSCRGFFVSHDSGQCTEFVFGEPLGCKATAPDTLRPECRSLNVLPGDILCLCSDGFFTTEKKNGGKFERNEAASLVKKYAALSPAHFAEKFQKAADGICGSGDDRTCQIFKYE